jgi:hypothetical protein
MSYIGKYDQALEQDIELVQRYIQEDIELAKTMMRNLSTSEKMINKVMGDERARGKRIFFEGMGLGADKLLQMLKELSQFVTAFPFRIYLTNPAKIFSGTISDEPALNNENVLSVRVITEEDDQCWIDTNVLIQEERVDFVKLIGDCFSINSAWLPYQYRVSNYYPSKELIKLVTKLQLKYQLKLILTKTPTRDEVAMSLFSQII